MNAWDHLLDDLAERVAARLEARLRGSPAGMLDQAASPLGQRRHCAAVRRRISHGESGAAVVGRRHLLSPEALSEELTRQRKMPDKIGEAVAARSVRAELERELQLIRGGK
ncbi:MAG: hypothetical protein RL685_6395 [Pseudomonadota bacterium]